jgi:phosphoenolpyruvate carboxykinase (ATP)
LNLTAPTSLPQVEEGLLDPRSTYSNGADWEEKAKKLAALYIKYFEQYATTEEGKRLVAAGPSL